MQVSSLFDIGDEDGTFGHVDKFDIHGKESFPNYLERLEFCFLANDISDDGKKKAIFLSSVGA